MSLHYNYNNNNNNKPLATSISTTSAALSAIVPQSTSIPTAVLSSTTIQQHQQSVQMPSSTAPSAALPSQQPAGCVVGVAAQNPNVSAGAVGGGLIVSAPSSSNPATLSGGANTSIGHLHQQQPASLISSNHHHHQIPAHQHQFHHSNHHQNPIGLNTNQTLMFRPSNTNSINLPSAPTSSGMFGQTISMEINLNAHNHPDKNGRTMCINYCNIVNGRSERKLKVYENNNKPTEDLQPIELCIILEQVFDKGAFGHVRTARIRPDNRSVAVKQVLQDKRYRNRELPLMKQLSHRNIVTLLYYFYHMEEKKNLFLNLVMEYIPSNLNMLIQKYNKLRKQHANSRNLPHGDFCLSSLSAGPVTPLFTIKLCMYQIFRGLAYIHSQGICHRDIKPNNLLFDPSTGVLKICDFGSAKHLRKGESHVSYICARFYRAPELLFGATDYNEKIDLWSTGVVFSELILGQPIFHEQSGIDQLVLIISKLGTPSKDQIKAMNQKYAKYDFPIVVCQPWQQLFPNAPTDALDLISKLFQYDPSHRIAPLHACAHQFFDELREPNKKWMKNDLPPLFDFTQYELSIDKNINHLLTPYKNF